MAKLVFKNDFMRPEYFVDRDVTSIGRAPENNLTIPDYLLFQGLPSFIQKERYRILVHVSRHHARIVRVENSYYITDTGNDGCGSSHGTFINDERVVPGINVLLKNGDRISFGLVEAIFHGA